MTRQGAVKLSKTPSHSGDIQARCAYGVARRPIPARHRRGSMQTKLALFLATAVSVAVISWQAQATPLSATKNVYQTNAVTLVAACVAGWHWSAALKRCVRN
jgi:hypothetical protein